MAMKILAVDIGTGTQDIYLYNSSLDMENNFKLVVPSPTMVMREKMKRATRHRDAILLTGVIMGGGPSTWAAEAHLQAGLQMYATAQAARTFNDDLDAVQAMGIKIVSEDEANQLPHAVKRVQFRDFDFSAIKKAFNTLGIRLEGLEAVAVGVFDHGNAPVGVSDRVFRFDYLDRRIREQNRLSAFAYRSTEVPSRMTRLQAVVDSAQELDCPLMVMDTAPAAVLGAGLDHKVAARERVLIANVGNFHTLAFRMGPGGIEGLFEHHTGFVDASKLDHLLRRLADSTLRQDEVFNDQGHGALMYDSSSLRLGEGEFDVVITGPRRNIFHLPQGETNPLLMRAYFPAPFGDMMISGCFGLLAATADVLPELSGPIQTSLYGNAGKGVAPWDTD
jgi:uncharacterized protein (DUF1786 family)